MKLAVFGNSTTVTKHLVQRALGSGFAVAVIENAAKPHCAHKNLLAIRGSTLDSSVMQKMMHQSDAVICVLQNPMHTLDMQSRQLLESIIAHMQSAPIKRLVVFSCVNPGIKAQRAPNWNSLERMMSILGKSTGKIISKSPAGEHASVADVLRGSDLDWTIVGHPPVSRTFDSDISTIKPDPELFGRELAKHIVSQVTDARNLRGIFMIPERLTQEVA